jgi:hypothetical protein
MPATRHARQTSAASYKLYGPHPIDIHVLQASILDNIQEITAFNYQDDIKMTPSSLMVAIRLLIKCDTALEIIENGLNIALPVSKFQYYRAVFTDYEDIILDQKQVLKTVTNVPDEIRQQALNLLEDHAS